MCKNICVCIYMCVCMCENMCQIPFGSDEYHSVIHIAVWIGFHHLTNICKFVTVHHVIILNSGGGRGFIWFHPLSCRDYHYYRTRRWRKFQREETIGEVKCCSAWVARRTHWWIERQLGLWAFSLPLSLSLTLSNSLCHLLSVSLYLSLCLSMSSMVRCSCRWNVAVVAVVAAQL